jgi:hypothetical protein
MDGSNIKRGGMPTSTIEVSNELLMALRRKAAAERLTVHELLSKLVGYEPESGEPLPPFKSGRGMLAKYGPAPSAEEIDENRRDMFRGFGEDF